MIKRGFRDTLFQAISLTFLSLVILAMLVPFYIVVITSVSTPAAVAAQKIYLLPTVIDFSAYAMVFTGTLIGHAFFVSLILLLVGTSINLTLTLSAGYVLAKKTLPGVRIITLAILFTMLFNGGLIPFYLTIKSLRLINSFWVMVLPTAVDTFLLIIAINYFRTIPASVEESARIEGANDFTVMVRIVFPISKPLIATLLLFYAVQRWNEWWYALIFINDQKLQPLQYIIRQLLTQISSVVNNSVGSGLMDSLRNQSGDAMKMAAIVLSTIPILVIYPFMTKYFNQGVLLGSIKE
jgi:putative aldouronate transport system permease protein